MGGKQPSKEQVRSIVSDHMSEQHARSQSDADVQVELDRLHSQLVDAAQALESGRNNPRQAICDAIMATSEFLEGQGFSTATLFPLNRVVFAIVALCNQNRPDPLFCEKAKGTKPKRSFEDAIRQGHLAALADAWLKVHESEEGKEVDKLKRAARRMTGAYFGTVSGTMLQTARSYQRQIGHHELVYGSYEKMHNVLWAEARLAGGEGALRLALEVQIDGLNAKAELRKR